jgi:hypothetical protein
MPRLLNRTTDHDDLYSSRSGAQGMLKSWGQDDENCHGTSVKMAAIKTP